VDLNVNLLERKWPWEPGRKNLPAALPTEAIVQPQPSQQKTFLFVAKSASHLEPELATRSKHGLRNEK